MPKFDNQRRDKLDRSLNSEVLGTANVETFERIDSQAIGDSPNDFLKHKVNNELLVLKHQIREENDGSLISDRLEDESRRQPHQKVP
jgi:hypothetical protein